MEFACSFSSHKMHIGVDVVSICNRFVYPMMIRVDKNRIDGI